MAARLVPQVSTEAAVGQLVDSRRAGPCGLPVLINSGLLQVDTVCIDTCRKYFAFDKKENTQTDGRRRHHSRCRVLVPTYVHERLQHTCMCTEVGGGGGGT